MDQFRRIFRDGDNDELGFREISRIMDRIIWRDGEFGMMDGRRK